MSMVDGVISIGLGECIERGEINPGKMTYAICKIHLRLCSGKHVLRYAVCVNSCWKSNEYFTMKEAREEIARLKDVYGQKMDYNQMVGICLEAASIDSVAIYKAAHIPIKGAQDWPRYVIVCEGVVVGNETNTPEQVRKAIRRRFVDRL